MVKNILSWTAWPLLFAVCMSIAGYGFANDKPLIFFNLAYLLLIISLFFLERYMPHEGEWTKPDGQTFASIAHTLTSKGTVQGILLFGGVIGLASLITPVTEAGYSIWPRAWPVLP